jgi:hypothetical protein
MRLYRGLGPALDAFFLPMYICYVDESGTVERSGNTDHFVLVGLAIPVDTWKEKDQAVSAIKSKYGLQEHEIHTAWMLRDYPEQAAIPDFAALSWARRGNAVEGARLLKLSKVSSLKQRRSFVKDYEKTRGYIHLTRAERRQCIEELADLVGSWVDARAFGDAHNKRHVSGTHHFDEAFAQIVTRFNSYLQFTGAGLGLLVQDKNETVSTRLTNAMREYHAEGTLWRRIDRIVETPMFVDSHLTSMVQLADLVAYATRRFFDNAETNLFNRIKNRFDRNRGLMVGLRHFTGPFQCRCAVCVDHGR